MRIEPLNNTALGKCLEEITKLRIEYDVEVANLKQLDDLLIANSELSEEYYKKLSFALQIPVTSLRALLRMGIQSKIADAEKNATELIMKLIDIVKPQSIKAWEEK